MSIKEIFQTVLISITVAMVVVFIGETYFYQPKPLSTAHISALSQKYLGAKAEGTVTSNGKNWIVKYHGLSMFKKPTLNNINVYIDKRGNLTKITCGKVINEYGALDKATCSPIHSFAHALKNVPEQYMASNAGLENCESIVVYYGLDRGTPYYCIVFEGMNIDADNGTRVITSANSNIDDINDIEISGGITMPLKKR